MMIAEYMADQLLWVVKFAVKGIIVLFLTGVVIAIIAVCMMVIQELKNRRKNGK